MQLYFCPTITTFLHFFGAEENSVSLVILAIFYHLINLSHQKHTLPKIVYHKMKALTHSDY